MDNDKINLCIKLKEWWEIWDDMHEIIGSTSLQSLYTKINFKMGIESYILEFRLLMWDY